MALQSPIRIAIFLCSALCATPPMAAGTTTASFTLFESGPVRPLAISRDGKTLYAVNTPNATLEVFRVSGGEVEPRGSVGVGIDPVAVAVRNDDEVWVVNHLSDSVSIVDVHDVEHPRITRTLLVGDEPRDIVFAGSRRDRAFITTAHRGQNNPNDPQLTTPGVGRADVWVFDAKNLGAPPGGTPLNILTLFTDTPRALAVTPDGARVYAAGFLSGNRTMTLPEGNIPDGGEANGGLPSTRVDAAGEEQPETGLVVKYNGEHWVDELGRVWDSRVRFSLPDKDVFAIDANANPPAPVTGDAGYFSGVGTVLFNMTVNPVNGKIYVSNTEAFNLRRFEGPGERLGRDRTVQGHLHESRITVLGPGGVQPRHLNKHIDYTQCCAPVPNAENARSLAQPMEMAITGDGKTLYVVAFGSSKIGVYKTAELEADTFTPDVDNQIPVSGGGPAGIVLDEARGRAYVLTRFDNGISTVDLRRKKERAHVTMFNPEPASIVQGRRFLYDASLTSSHGDSSCSSCHVFGDFDGLAWDLGNPDDTTINNPGPFALGPTIDFPQGFTATLNPHFRALKGPMSTQSLRGMDNHGAMHWRGDRTGGNDEPSVQPNGGAFSEDLAFKKFNVAFVGLLGRDAMLAPEQMQAFTDFILQVMYPPNPIRNLDNSLTADQAAGRAMYFGQVSDTFFNCNVCHVLDPDGNREFGIARPGFFGTDGRYSFENETQFLKVPHLRNMYQKVGMFGMAPEPFFIPGDNDHTGDQVRGFGFFHDGSADTLFRFHGARVFLFRPPGALSALDPGNPGGFPFVPPNHPQAGTLNPLGVKMRRQMEQFMLAFDTNFAPIVGQQVTVTRANADAAAARIELFKSQADAGACDLVIAARTGERERGYLYKGNGSFQSRSGTLNDADLRALTLNPKAALTWTCAPPGSGERLAFRRKTHDRDD